MRKAFSVSIFARNEGAVLLILHKRLETWLPVGGEVEDGETPLEAAKRELKEETGLDGVFPVTSDIEGTPAGLIAYEEHQAGSKGTHMNFVFVADVNSRDVIECDEYTEHKWVESTENLYCPINVVQLMSKALSKKRT